MMKLVKSAAVAIAFFGAACAAQAQTRPVVTIEDASWLAGRWVGEGLGGQIEETWAPPSGGQMVGHFRLTRDGAPAFYEIMLMDIVEGGVRMRVKHFNPDFVGWEEKDDWHSFEPVSATAEALAFRGLTLRRLRPDELEIRLNIRYDTGPREEVLTMRRAPM